MDFKEKTNDELSGMDVHELAGYYNTLNEVKSAEIDEAINAKSSKKEVAELYNTYKKETEAQVEKMNSILVEQGLKIKKLTEKEIEVAGDTIIISSLKNGLKKNVDKLKGLKGSMSEARNSEFSLEIKAPMTYAAGDAPLGELPQPYREPGVYDERRSVLGFLPYVSQTAISSNVVSWVKKAERKNEAGPVPEGESKPESRFALQVEQAFLLKYANYIKVSTEMLDDIGFLEGEIDRELIGNLLEDVDKDCFDGGQNTGEISGIFNSGETFGAGTFSGTVLAPNILDVLVVAMAQMEGEFFYKASAIFLNPLDLAKLKVTKDLDNNYQNRLIVTAGTQTLDGVPIYTSAHVEPDKFAVCDMSQIRMYVKEGVQVEFGMSGNDFTENLRTILSEWRGVLRIVDTKAIITGEIASAQKELAASS